MSQSNRLLGAPLRVELADLLDHDFATVGRKRMFRKPLGADENHSPGQQNRTAYAEGSALKNPGEALLSLRRRGISKRQARQHEHPPSQFDAVDRDIHKTMQHRRQGCGDDTPTKRPGTRIPQTKDIPDQQSQKRQSQKKRGNSRLGGQHEPIALWMNRHRLVDACLHVERKNIPECPEPRPSDRVVPDDMQGIEKNFGPQIAREELGLGRLLHTQEVQNTIAGLTLGYQKNPNQRAGNGEGRYQQRQRAVRSAE